MKLSITEGYVYQRPNELVEVTNKSFSKSLKSLAFNSRCEVITKEEAYSVRGVVIVDWSTPEDKLILINNSIILCCRDCDIKA